MPVKIGGVSASKRTWRMDYWLWLAGQYRTAALAWLFGLLAFGLALALADARIELLYYHGQLPR